MTMQSIATTDYHTAGEPFRIVPEPPVPLPGGSVADRRTRALASPAAQELRRTLCSEPRGHADMYGGFIGIGREIKRALDADGLAVHPTDPRLSGVYGTILYEELGISDGGGTDAGPVHQRNVTVFADGRVDRSPCGSGTAARLAILADDGRVSVGGPVLRHESIVGSTFTGTVVDTALVGGLPAVVPMVTGMAYRTGEHRFLVDGADPWSPGSCCDERAPCPRRHGGGSRLLARRRRRRHHRCADPRARSRRGSPPPGGSAGGRRPEPAPGDAPTRTGHWSSRTPGCPGRTW